MGVLKMPGLVVTVRGATNGRGPGRDQRSRLSVYSITASGSGRDQRSRLSVYSIIASRIRNFIPLIGAPLL
jgi:hypothetical protein